MVSLAEGDLPLARFGPERTARREQASPEPRDQIAPKKEDSRFQMTGTVRLEGTNEPIAGAKVQVDLGTLDLHGDMREALTDANGHYTIALPEGNARPWILIPPPGYWLPDANKRLEFFAVTPQQPVYRKDYFVRRGSVWKFLLTSGPRHQPAPSASISSYAMPGERPIPIRCLANNEGSATATLPSEGGKVTLSLSPKVLTETRLLVKLNWDGGFRPDAVKTLKHREDPRQPAHFQLTDEAGRSATLSGPIDAAITAGHLVVSASFPEADSKATGILTGTVVDRDGHPIADANVTIYFAYRDWARFRDRMSTERGPTLKAGTCCDRFPANLPMAIPRICRWSCGKTVMRESTRD